MILQYRTPGADNSPGDINKTWEIHDAQKTDALNRQDHDPAASSRRHAGTVEALGLLIGLVLGGIHCSPATTIHPPSSQPTPGDTLSAVSIASGNDYES